MLDVTLRSDGVGCELALTCLFRRQSFVLLLVSGSHQVDGDRDDHDGHDRQRKYSPDTRPVETGEERKGELHLSEHLRLLKRAVVVDVNERVGITLGPNTSVLRIADEGMRRGS